MKHAKRLAVLISILVLLLLGPSVSLAARIIYCYDFDLHFHLDAEEYSLRDRARIQGYADLLESLDLKGNLAWCPQTESMDLHVDLIPVSNPSAAISFRLYGLPDYMCLTSPLLESETIFLHNYALMEFAGKAWQTFHIPLPYLVMLDPYVTTGAFSSMVDKWKEQFPRIRRSKKLTSARLGQIVEGWKELLETDYRLTSWIAAVCAPLEDGSILEREIKSIPDLLLSITKGKHLTASVNGGNLKILGRKSQVLYEQTSNENSFSCFLTLPSTESVRYIPSLSYVTEEKDGLRSLSLQASWNASDSLLSENGTLPVSLLDLNLNMDGIPGSFPTDASIHAAIRINGYALPNCDYTIHLDSHESGNILLTISTPIESRGTVPVFTCSGTITPAAYPSTRLKFKTHELIKNFNIFSVNDQSLYDFVHRTARPLFTGLLNFLYEIPASSFQSIMDDLEEYGILEMILK